MREIHEAALVENANFTKSDSQQGLLKERKQKYEPGIYNNI